MRVIFVTDAPFARDIRLQRSVEALNALEGEVEVFILDQGLLVEESQELLADKGVLCSPPVPQGGVGRYWWHVKNRLISVRAYKARARWIQETTTSLKPDIIHCINPFALEACVAAARETNAQLIYEAYEYWPDYLDCLGGRIPQVLAGRLKAAEKAASKEAVCFITVSEPLSEWYQADFDIEPPLVIYNVNTADGKEVLSPSGEPLASEPLTGELSLVYSGILLKERNVDIAIRALVLTEKVHLFIQGDGPEKVHLQQIVQELNLSDKVSFIDMVPANQLVDSLKEFDLGLTLLPATSKQMNGAVPNKVFDYVRAGLGVLSVGTAGVRSLTGIQESIRYIDMPCPNQLAAAIKEVQKKRDDLAAMKISSRENGPLYSREEQMRKLQDVYAAL
ncbi:MAG: glycosyltransferase [Coriobacteriia bacterium]|nr:glycosyltransferase [Coriobacteriia bacterium]